MVGYQGAAILFPKSHLSHNTSTTVHVVGVAIGYFNGIFSIADPSNT